MSRVGMMRVIVLSMLCAAVTGLAQTVSNASFELGGTTLTNWTATSGTWSYSPVSNTGLRSLKLQKSAYNGFVTLTSDPIAVTAGQYYMASYWINRQSSSCGDIHNISIQTKSGAPDDAPSTADQFDNVIHTVGQWEQVQFPIKMKAGFDRVQLKFQYTFTGDGDITAFLDDFSLKLTNDTYCRYEPLVPATTTPPPLNADYTNSLLSRPWAEAVLTNVAGRIRVNINGTNTAPTYYSTFLDHTAASKTDDSKRVLPIQDFRDANVHIYNVMIPIKNVWTNNSTSFDYSSISNALISALRNDPTNGYVLVRLQLVPYLRWGEDYPNDVMCDENGAKIVSDAATHPIAVGRVPDYAAKESYSPSYVSSTLRAQTTNALRSIINYIQTMPEGKAVIGYTITGGNDTTFRPVDYAFPTNWTDYCAASSNAFHTWLTQRYASDAALTNAWGVSGITRANAPIPSQAQRKGTAFFMTNTTDMAVVDFETFMVQGTGETIEFYASAIKEFTARKALVGTYHLGHNNIHLGALLNSTNIDYVVGVGGNGSTASRDLGGIPGNGSFPGSISLHNRMFISEFDARTFKVKPEPDGFSLCGWASNETAYIAMTKRESGFMLSQGHGEYWFDMTGGWFSTNTLMQVTDGGIAGIQRAFTSDLQNPGRPYAELAVFLDEESALYIDPDLRRNWMVNIFQKQMDSLNASGVPYHFYLQKDLTNSALPDYKAYIFLNAYKISAAEKTKIASLKTAGKKICFTHAPNIIGTNNPSGGIQAITGIAVTNNSSSQLLMVLPTNGASGYSTVFGGTVDSLSGNLFTGPSYKVTDVSAGVTNLGVYAAQQTVIAAAIKGNVIFCGSPDMQAEFVNDFARWAGAWVAAEPGDGVFVNRYWLTIHAATSGTKEINLAELSRVVDFTSGALYSTQTTTVATSMTRGQTRWFALTPKPVLNSIADKTNNAGSTLTFTVAVSNPGPNRVFSLDAGAPAGASIDAVTGVFTWTSPLTQVPGDYSVTVSVTDGTMTDTETFTVTVKAPGSGLLFRLNTVNGTTVQDDHRTPLLSIARRI